eukprot:CAMPEP_0204526596 /NCGR_PEP_ID=MMETSP0661-20131031/8530_1 /ASSEMBLY_ACC=CAM_ASM_000606 /TAXON_ID=109239 /ORGANISM="Alexandrium margalefi, Strain AMGDE01CS-322" /LENGTH=390 /DNA_ID=CAMNT_0051532451 /DNA_START=43 /DNA_END=1213 /DNA_ORIENTATION=-
MAAVATAEGCGVDERAIAKLQTLPEEEQQDIISRLLEGQATGNIHNPSGFVVSEAVKASRRFPGAGMIAIQSGHPTMGAGEIAATLEALGVDAEASALLRQLPLGAQAEILGQLQELQASGAARNPSAWTARAANNYAREKLGVKGLVPTTSGGGPPQMQLAQPHQTMQWTQPMQAIQQTMRQPIQPTEVLSPEMLGVDEPASQVLMGVPPHVQQQLLAELKDGLSKGFVQNPSGWMVKAAKRHGAGSSPGYGAAPSPGYGAAPGPGYAAMPSVPSPEQFGVDERAAEMVRKLPPAGQREVLDLLAKGLAAGNVNNPSGFVVKKTLLVMEAASGALGGGLRRTEARALAGTCAGGSEGGAAGGGLQRQTRPEGLGRPLGRDTARAEGRAG